MQYFEPTQSGAIGHRDSYLQAMEQGTTIDLTHISWIVVAVKDATRSMRHCMAEKRRKCVSTV